MENVTDALQMAFAVLAFVISLSISIWAFDSVRTASESILKEKDREEEYTYMDYEPGQTTRKVKIYDIVPTLYRAYKENYIIQFIGIGPLYEVKGKDGIFHETSKIDLEGQTIRNHEDAAKFITALLKGNLNDLRTNTNNYNFISQRGYLQTKGLYDIIKDSNFEERLGVFYQEDRIGNGESMSGSGMEDVNKTKKRIITYTKIP